MTKKTNTIEINGQRYDTKTGALVNKSAVHKASGMSIDGVVTHAAAKDPAQQPISEAVHVPRAPSSPLLAKPVMDVARTPAKHLASHHPQHTKTLMRAAVKKPGSDPNRHIHARSNIDPAVPSLQTKQVLEQIDHAREQRAAHTHKSKLINRFSKHPATDSSVWERPPATRKAPPVKLSPTAPQPSMDIFEKALQNATGHEQTYVAPKSPRKAKRRALIIGGSVAIVAIIGFFTVQNSSNIKLYFASSKAGFSADLPAYKPNGFNLSSLNASTGTVAATFRGTTKGQNFSIVEQPSDWDSQTLKDAYVNDAAGQNYQTIESAGRTIYFYGNHNATWVNGGIWYLLRSNSSLSDEQLIQIATSM